jgi:hypothetical protein
MPIYTFSESFEDPLTGQLKILTVKVNLPENLDQMAYTVFSRVKTHLTSEGNKILHALAKSGLLLNPSIIDQFNLFATHIIKHPNNQKLPTFEEWLKNSRPAQSPATLFKAVKAGSAASQTFDSGENKEIPPSPGSST